MMLSSQETELSAPSQGVHRRADFPHYSFFVVETWCAYGQTMEAVETFREKIVADPVAWNDSVLSSVARDSPELLGQRTDDGRGSPSFKVRKLATWPPNPLWTEFLLELGMDDEGCANAQGQLDVFMQKKSWPGEPQCKRAFFMAIQLWYYGYTTNKVRSLGMYCLCMRVSSNLCFVFLVFVFQ